MDKPETSRTVVRRVGIAAALALGAIATPSQAQVFAPLIAPAVSVVLADTTCPVAPLAPSSSFSPERPQISKASAILGGGTSALEAMRAQQTSFESMGPLIPGAGPSIDTGAAPIPTVALAIPTFSDCAPVAGTATNALAAVMQPLEAGIRPSADFLASRRVPIGRTMFDASWSRVSGDKPKMTREIRRLVGGEADLDNRLAAINSWVNRRIAYTEDKDLFGKADYWAGAKRTLQLGKGDCEDYALLKMKLLEAAGISREDMFLTVALDLVRRADHAVLIVRTPDGYRMLDNNTDTVLDATDANDYRPVLSFSGRKSWLHGY